MRLLPEVRGCTAGGSGHSWEGILEEAKVISTPRQSAHAQPWLLGIPIIQRVFRPQCL